MRRILPYAHTKDSFYCLRTLILHSTAFKTAAVCFGWREQTGTGRGYITQSILRSLSSTRPKIWEYYCCTTVFELAFCSSSADKADRQSWHYNTQTLVLRRVTCCLNTNSEGFVLAERSKRPHFTWFGQQWICQVLFQRGRFFIHVVQEYCIRVEQIPLPRCMY